MFNVVVEKNCPECGSITNISDKVSQAQLDWLNDHPNHDTNCANCLHRGIFSRVINLSAIRSMFDDGQRLDDIAHSLNVKVTIAARGLTIDQKKSWRELRRGEIAEEKAKREEARKAKKAAK